MSAHPEESVFADWGTPAAAGSPAADEPDSGFDPPRADPRVPWFAGLAVILAIAALVRAFTIDLGGYSISARIGTYAGTVAIVLVAAALVAAAVDRRRRPLRVRVVTVLCAIVAAGLVASVVAPGATGPGAWSSQRGVQTRAGFVDGCTNSGMPASACGCVFAQLAAEPAYDTPERFVTLDSAAGAFEQTHSPSDLPAGYLAALRACPAR